jgi:NAD(P)-dependent dehydrogenase (short-subunit alcohol dehydrogenase family)
MTKTVLITGGNRGLGRALVDCFAVQENWKVIATARRLESLPDVAEQKL